MSEIDDMRDEMLRLKERIAALERQQQPLPAVSPPPSPRDQQRRDQRPRCRACGCIGLHACMGPPWLRGRWGMQG